METKTHTIELKAGWKSPDGKIHKTVTFGKPVTGEMLFLIDSDPIAEIFTQRELAAIRLSITAFGSHELMPPPILALLDLDEFDLNDLTNGYDEFSAQIMEGRTPEFISDTEVLLSKGFEKDGLLFPRVTFGRVITGRDMVAADKEGFQRLKRTCFFIGRQIVSISTHDGSNMIQGQVGIELFNSMYSGEIDVLRLASERWRSSFRRQRESIPSDGAHGLDTGEGNRVE